MDRPATFSLVLAFTSGTALAGWGELLKQVFGG